MSYSNDDWLEIVILTGLQKLACLSLERTPAAEMLVGTAQAWREALTDGRAWDELRDMPRIERAFRTLSRTMRRWPVPAEFIDALPAVEQQAIGYEVKPATREQVEQRMAEIRETLGTAADVVKPMDAKCAAAGDA